MTIDEITKMPAGAEIDTIVAERVMGRPPVPAAESKGTYGILPAYSTKIASAWQVLEKLQERFTSCEVYWSRTPYAGAEKHWRVLLRPYGYRGLEVWADTAPLAICRAALLSLIEPKG